MTRRQHAGAGRTALVAMLSALSLAVLCLAGFLPAGRLGMVALAGLVPAAAVISAGLSAGFLCYAAAGLLGLLLSPDKGTAALYLLFFGLYPMLKSLVERLDRRALEWILKLAFFNLALSVFWFGLSGLFLPFLPELLRGGAGLAYPVGNLVFIAYDCGFSRLIAFYMVRIHRALGRR